MAAFIVLRKQKSFPVGGPRDRKFAETAARLAELLQTLATKSQLLDNPLLACYQHRMEVLTEQIEGTMQREGIAYVGA